MTRGESVGGKLAALSALRDDLRSIKALDLLRRSLEDRSCRVVERAADLVAETEDKSFVADLLQAYRRLKDNDPVKDDPGCLGKTAILRALVRLDHADAEIYRDGIEYRQPEPVWNGEKDTAAELRGICAAGLIGCVGSLEVLNRCAVLMVDKYPEARAGAARAIGALSVPEGAALLRLKLLVGDASPEVFGECCSALLKLDREGGFEFVVQFLSQGADPCVQAALALGESRIAAALAPLRSAWERRRETSVRKSLLICIGLLRSSESREFLLSRIDRKDLVAAVDAIDALKMHGAAGDIRKRAETAVAATGDAGLKCYFEKEWAART